MKFTKEEISLCKQVAEKHRKKIDWGEWALFNDKIHLVIDLPVNEESIPLWTISDCLEFLKERNYDCILYSKSGQSRWYLKFNIYPLVSSMEILNGGKTPLEVCLKAVLAVLEEET